ncbi:matrixin family metalloprotease [Halocatena halophila]|uniref:matrixin family metalloprotease n=1 Tax=Halocatena halophila TaxID=2814576 RepID=UPI002ED2DB37
MRRRLTILSLIVMMVLAGCSGGVTNPLTDSPSDTGTAGPHDGGDTVDNTPPTGTVVTEGPIENETEQTETPTDTPADSTGDKPVSEDNPWGERTLTVAIDDQMDDGRAYESIVENALSYWEENSEKYAGYPIEYEIGSDAEAADLVISFVPNIESCNTKENVQGCAPLYVSEDQIKRPTNVEIQGTYNETSTKLLVIHELGHTLGLRHGDAPKQIMAAKSDFTTIPKTDAHEKDWAWDHTPLTVAVDTSSVAPHKQQKVSKQVDAAINYYNSKAGSHIPEQASFRRVDSMEDADIKITVDSSSTCSQSGDCAQPFGYDPDHDNRLENYAFTEISVSDANPDAVGWYVARRIGIGALGYTSIGEFPTPLRSSQPESVRTSRWWE